MLTKIGPYHIEAELGRGAMGTVYLGRHAVFDELVAIKVIMPPPDWMPDERAKYVQAFEREARAGKRLDDHPNIVKTRDYFPDIPCIVMEYVNGKTLAQHLADEWQASTEQLHTVWRESAGALDHAHNKGVIHRDVSARNIMLTDEGMVKVCDFGVAKLLKPGTGIPITAVGEVKGTTRYMSPEHLQGKAVDGRADQYSLAVLIHLILTKKWVFPGEPESRLILQIITEPPRVAQTLPKGTQEAIRRALEKTPDARFPSCTAFINALTGEHVAVDPRATTTRVRTPARLEPHIKTAALHQDPLERVGQLQALLFASATSGITDEAQYIALRRSLLDHPLTRGLLPGVVNRSPTHKECLKQLIRGFPQQHKRTEFLAEAFQETIASAKQRDGHSKIGIVSIVLESFDVEGVSKVWQKSLDRCRLQDFSGAITAARTMLETVCRRILQESGTEFSQSQPLPKLYGQVAKVLQLAPQEAANDELKRVLGGCQNIVTGVAALRNMLGDAHAASIADRYQAELAVQVAGAMASFLVATWHRLRARGES